MLQGVISLLVVGIVCGFWVIVLSRALYKMFKGRNISSAQHGRIVSGRIISVLAKGSGKLRMMTILVEFPNFSNSEVTKSFSFKDTKPELNRYEEGKSIQLVLKEDQKNGPSVELSGGEKRRSPAASFVIFALWSGSVYGSYYLYLLTSQRIGGDWSNLEPIAENPVVALTGGILLVTLVFIGIVFRAVGLLPNKKKAKRDDYLLLYGIRTTATILKQEETGTRINNQPVIRFHYSYSTDFGGTFKGQDQMVLGAIELAKQVNQTETEILYDRDEKSSSRMIAAMNKSSIQGCVGLIFLFMALIFSTIILVMYLVQPV